MARRARASALRWRAARVTIGAALLVAGFSQTALAATTTLVQQPGTAGCVAKDGLGGCAAGRGVGGVTAVVLSPDGANAYVASGYGDSLAVFDRAGDGTLAQKAGVAGCFAEGIDQPCTPATALRRPADVALSADGTSLYVATDISDAIAVFDRAADGTLTQKPGAAGCISEVGACTVAHDLVDPADVVVSPDGATVYALTTLSGKLLVFDRASDGALTERPGPAGCIAEVPSATCADGRALAGATGLAISADGRSLYVSARDSDAIALFDLAADGAPAQKPGAAGCISADGPGGACGFAKALRAPSAVTVSPSGSDVYVTAEASAGVAAFDRAADGTLTQKPGAAGCVSSLDSKGACASAGALTGPTGVGVSPDGANVYVTTSPANNFLVPDGAVAIFDRAADGSIVQKPGLAGCVYEGSVEPRCASARTLTRPRAVAVSPDSASVYVAARDSYGVSIFRRGPFVAPPPPPAVPAPDTIKPLLRGLALRPARLRAASRGPAVVARGGARVSYRLSEPATVTFTVQRVVAGRRVAGRCVALGRANRRARGCDRYRPLRGSFAGPGVAGRNAFRFSGRLGKHALVAGRYRLRGVARDAAGNRSRAAVARFQIRR